MYTEKQESRKNPYNPMNLVEHLLVDILEKISEECIKNKYNAFQINERYGFLRFYMSRESDRIFDLIHNAEKKSLSLCELCGKPAKTRYNSRSLATLCDEHCKSSLSSLKD